jgi:hypothetical protein
MDLDKEMELLMTGKVVEPDPPVKLFARELDAEGKPVYVFRFDQELLGWLITYLSGIWVGLLLAKRG